LCKKDANLIYGAFTSLGALQKELKNREIEILSSNLEWIQQLTKVLTENKL
jgi:DNA-binding transcriptional regulator WhiA